MERCTLQLRCPMPCPRCIRGSPGHHRGASRLLQCPKCTFQPGTRRSPPRRRGEGGTSRRPRCTGRRRSRCRGKSRRTKCCQRRTSHSRIGRREGTDRRRRLPETSRQDSSHSRRRSGQKQKRTSPLRRQRTRPDFAAHHMSQESSTAVRSGIPSETVSAATASPWSAAGSGSSSPARLWGAAWAATLGSA